MEAGYLESVECPICFDVPEKEIFQCKNGHTFCSLCEQRLRRCPQCKVNLDKPNIRNRALEDLLDKMKFDCDHKTLGCTIKVNRSQISTHRETCKFGSSGNGPKICEALGFSCGYTLNTVALSQAVNHFKNTHDFIVCQKMGLKLSLEGFKGVLPMGNSMWTPVVVDRTAHHRKFFIILSLLNHNDQSLSLSCLEINDGPRANAVQFRASFVIDAVSSANTPHLIWTSTPTDAKYGAFAINEPMIRLPLKQLRDHYTSGTALALKFSLRESTDFTTAPTTRNPETLILFNTPRNVPKSISTTPTPAAGIFQPPQPNRFSRPNLRPSIAVPRAAQPGWRNPITNKLLVKDYNYEAEVISNEHGPH